MGIFKCKNAEVHMEQGPIGRTLLMFAAPILLSQILQQMYSIADCMIVGHFGGGNGLAAAGEAALILSVIINFFVGFSTGVSAVTAAAFGGFQYQKLSRILHAVVLMSLISGAVMTVAGIGCSGIFLQWIHCPEEVFSPGTVLSANLYDGHYSAVYLQYGKCDSAFPGEYQRTLVFPHIFIGIESGVGCVICDRSGNGTSGSRSRNGDFPVGAGYAYDMENDQTGCPV